MSMSSWASTSSSPLSSIDLSARTRFSNACRIFSPRSSLSRESAATASLDLMPKTRSVTSKRIPSRPRSIRPRAGRAWPYLLGAEVAALPPLVKLRLPVIGDQVGARCPGLQRDDRHRLLHSIEVRLERVPYLRVAAWLVVRFVGPADDLPV